MKKLSITVICTLYFLVVPSVYSESNYYKPNSHRHSHGHGTLTLVGQNNLLTMKLHIPVYDILGFEAISTKAHQFSLNRVLEKLKSNEI